jgi:hypothetical protein
VSLPPREGSYSNGRGRICSLLPHNTDCLPVLKIPQNRLQKKTPAPFSAEDQGRSDRKKTVVQSQACNMSGSRDILRHIAQRARQCFIALIIDIYNLCYSNCPVPLVYCTSGCWSTYELLLLTQLHVNSVFYIYHEFVAVGSVLLAKEDY